MRREQLLQIAHGQGSGRAAERGPAASKGTEHNLDECQTPQW